MKRIFFFSFLLLSLSIFSCEKSDQIIIELTAQDVQEGKGPKWSPYGQKMELTEVDNGFETKLEIGKEPGNHWGLRLEKTADSEYFNILYIDQNQNGSFEEEERINTEPSETRGKIWSSFKAKVYTTVDNPWTKKVSKNVYPISLWYVFDPNEKPEKELLRFSRNGWLEGSANIEGVAANILIAESTMDARIDTADNWSLAPEASLKELYDYRNNKSIKSHAWLNDKAYRLVEVDPSGMKVILEAFDPGMSRVEEAEQLDIYGPDKKASRTGKSLSFSHNFEEALSQAQKEGKSLFIDFETTWCGPCKIMDKLVYTADDVVKAADQIVAVKIDGDEHRDLVKRFEVKAYPTLILLSPDEEVIDQRVGYQSVKSTVAFFDNAK